jgi:CDP-glucose 4,6-dehydratase
MEQFARLFKGKRILVTGHTGFKGSWLCEWLLTLGAEVWGYSLSPPTDPALFEQLGLASRVHHQIGDVRDLATVKSAVLAARPDFVFHLAAQPLVRLSYEQPVETYAVNVQGTVHVLEALRAQRNPCVAVMITTDKCYENVERVEGYREEDPLGGHDPYSSSKAAAEIAIASYRRSFFPPAKLTTGKVPPVAVASARAGNVIGGGDWARDRIVPDCVRALARGEVIGVRNPRSTRPWQHVLEPLSGYLTLAAQMHGALAERSNERLEALCSAFNFGPPLASNRSVREVVEELLRNWPGRWEDRSDPGAVHEAGLLNLITDKAQRVLGWRSRWDFAETVARTAQWYRLGSGPAQSAELAEFTRRQIADYSA